MPPASRRSKVPRRSRNMVADNQYYVEAILDERIDANGDPEYLIKWEGYPREEANWEPRANIDESPITEWNQGNAEVEELEQRSDDIATQQPQEEADGASLRDEPVREEAEPPLPSYSPSDTRKGFLDRVGANRIVGTSRTRYLVSHTPDAITGVPRAPIWLPHGLVDRDRAREWEQLRQSYENALRNMLGAEDDQNSAGAIWGRQHEIARTRGVLLIRRIHDIEDDHPTTTEPWNPLTERVSVQTFYDSVGGQPASGPDGEPRASEAGQNPGNVATEFDDDDDDENDDETVDEDDESGRRPADLESDRENVEDERERPANRDIPERRREAEGDINAIISERGEPMVDLASEHITFAGSEWAVPARNNGMGMTPLVNDTGMPSPALTRVRERPCPDYVAEDEWAERQWGEPSLMPEHPTDEFVLDD